MSLPERSYYSFEELADAWSHHGISVSDIKGYCLDGHLDPVMYLINRKAMAVWNTDEQKYVVGSCELTGMFSFDRKAYLPRVLDGKEGTIAHFSHDGDDPKGCILEWSTDPYTYFGNVVSDEFSWNPEPLDRALQFPIVFTVLTPEYQYSAALERGLCRNLEDYQNDPSFNPAELNLGIGDLRISNAQKKDFEVKHDLSFDTLAIDRDPKRLNETINKPSNKKKARRRVNSWHQLVHDFFDQRLGAGLDLPDAQTTWEHLEELSQENGGDSDVIIQVTDSGMSYYNHASSNDQWVKRSSFNTMHSKKLSDYKKSKNISK